MLTLEHTFGNTFGPTSGNDTHSPRLLRQKLSASEMADVAELENHEVVVENPKKTILEELFGEIHEFADGESRLCVCLWVNDYVVKATVNH